MSIFTVLRNIFLIVVLVGIVLMVSHFAEPVKNMALGMINVQDENVLGASSQRAQEITGKVGEDFAKQAEAAKEQFLNIKFGDVLSILLRAQQIPQDISSIHEFVKEQSDNILSNQK